MANDEVWAQRVADWKASGLSSPEFCKDKPFTPGGLRHMAFRLERTAIKPRASVRLARLVRIAPHESSATTGAALVIDISGARVAVPPGVDRATLATVVDVLTAATGRAR